jgi:hypothetical protein
MTSQPRRLDADSALIANAMMYGYVPMEMFRDTTAAPLEPEQQPPYQWVDGLSTDQDQGFDVAWLPMILALVLGLLGITSIVVNPRLTHSLAIHAKNTVTEIGLPHRWNF